MIDLVTNWNVQSMKLNEKRPLKTTNDDLKRKKKDSLEIELLKMFEVVEETNYSTIIGTSLRNVIEHSQTDLVLPYKILCQFHLSSWNSFQHHLQQTLNRNSITDHEFVLLHRFDFEDKQSEMIVNFDKDFECLINWKV